MSITAKTAAVSACLGFIACAIIVLASYQGNKQILLDNTSQFGNIVATQLAQNARDAIIHRDKISLQAMLSELAKQPRIQQASIYDVQNQPIAQAGEMGAGFDYTASITFQDSIAGYAVITIASSSLAGPGVLALQLFILALILAGLVYASILLWSRQLTKPGVFSPDSRAVAADSGDDIAASGNDNPDPRIIANHSRPIVEDQIAITDRAFLHIGLGNMPSPDPAIDHQQLKTTEWIKKQLEDICQLYEGQLASLSSDSFNATFYNTDDDSYPFRALCCAKLASHLFAEQGGLHCDFGLALYRQHDEPGDPGEQVVIEKIAQLARQNQGRLVAGADFIAHHSIQGRVETQAINPAAIAIMALKEPYESLLERQLKTLKIQQRLQAD